MGKATILSGGTDGLYQVQVKYDRTRVDSEIAKLQNKSSELDVKISEAETALNDAKADTMSKGQAMDAAISTYQQNPTPENKSALEEAQDEYKQALKVQAAAQTRVNILTNEKTSTDKRIQFLENNIPADYEASVWCADFSEDLTGDVGTIEVGRVEPASIIIKPAGAEGGKAAYQSARDGQLQHVLGGTPASAYYNYAMLPGAAKWKPMHRTGTITALDGDFCDISLDSIFSTHQELSADQSTSLTAVPIEYLDCNGAAFVIDDQVVIEFTGQDWSSPKVIGFKSNPQRCGIKLIGPDNESTVVNDRNCDGPRSRPTGATNEYSVVGGTPPYTWVVDCPPMCDPDQYLTQPGTDPTIKNLDASEMCSSTIDYGTDCDDVYASATGFSIGSLTVTDSEGLSARLWLELPMGQYIEYFYSEWSYPSECNIDLSDSPACDVNGEILWFNYNEDGALRIEKTCQEIDGSTKPVRITERANCFMLDSNGCTNDDIVDASGGSDPYTWKCSEEGINDTSGDGTLTCETPDYVKLVLTVVKKEYWDLA